MYDSHRTARIRRIRAIIHGTAARPRVSVERTAKHFRAQAIDDGASRTIAAASDQAGGASPAGVAQATAVGTALAGDLVASGIKQVVLDRRGHRYHGRIKAFAEALRAGGIQL